MQRNLFLAKLQVANCATGIHVGQSVRSVQRKFKAVDSHDAD